MPSPLTKREMEEELRRFDKRLTIKFAIIITSSALIGLAAVYFLAT